MDSYPQRSRVPDHIGQGFPKRGAEVIGDVSWHIIDIRRKINRRFEAEQLTSGGNLSEYRLREAHHGLHRIRIAQGPNHRANIRNSGIELIDGVAETSRVRLGEFAGRPTCQQVQLHPRRIEPLHDDVV